MASITQTYTTAGTFTWVCPTDVTSLQVELWGAGGNGGGKTAAGGGGGGGGGAYARTNAVSVTAGTAYTIVVGAPSAVGTGDGGNGANSTFGTTTVVAAGGSGGGGGAGSSETGGAGGTTAASTGADQESAGGVGGLTSLATDGGGGGGEAGGTGGTGGAGGAGTSAVVGGAGGTGVNTDGGDGGQGRNASEGIGNNGVAPGGGGGGAVRTANSFNGGQGAAGQAVLTYTSSTILAQDDFERANSDSMGANWTEGQGDWDITSAQARTNTAPGALNLANWAGTFTPANANYSASCNVTQVGSNGGVGPIVRYVDANNFYAATLNTADGALELYKVVGGVVTELGTRYSASQINGVNYNIKLTVSGTSLTVYQDGTSRVTATDSALSATGTPALFSDNDSSRADNFLVEGTAAGGVTVKTLSALGVG